MSQDEEEILRKDREAHPGCNYSHSVSKQCSNDAEGKFVCESVKRIMRICPRKPPTTVFESTTKGSEESLSSQLGDLFGGFSVFDGFNTSKNKVDRNQAPFGEDSLFGDAIKQIDDLLTHSPRRAPAPRQPQQHHAKKIPTPVPPRRFEDEDLGFPTADEFDQQLSEALGGTAGGSTEGPITRA